MIVEIFPSGPIETNAYLLGCAITRRACLIDAPMESAERVMRRAEELGLQIDMLLLTHSHWDHMADAALIKARLSIPVYVHRDDAENLSRPGADQLPLYFPIQGVQPDGYLTDGQKLQVGQLILQVIHTPGHSPGCVCFYLPEEKTLISGDTLFQGTIGNLSLPSSRPDLMRGSLQKLAALPFDTKVYPGHGSPTTIGAERWIARSQENF